MAGDADKLRFEPIYLLKVRNILHNGDGAKRMRFVVFDRGYPQAVGSICVAYLYWNQACVVLGGGYGVLLHHPLDLSHDDLVPFMFHDGKSGRGGTRPE